MGIALQVAIFWDLSVRLPLLRLKNEAPPAAALASTSGRANPDAQVEQIRYLLRLEARQIDP